MDQFAVLEVLDVLKAAQIYDQIRQAAETIYQALIEAELTAMIGAAPHQRTEARAGLPQRAPAADDHHDGGWPGAVRGDYGVSRANTRSMAAELAVPRVR